MQDQIVLAFINGHSKKKPLCPSRYMFMPGVKGAIMLIMVLLKCKWNILVTEHDFCCIKSWERQSFIYNCKYTGHLYSFMQSVFIHKSVKYWINSTVVGFFHSYTFKLLLFLIMLTIDIWLSCIAMWKPSSSVLANNSSRAITWVWRRTAGLVVRGLGHHWKRLLTFYTRCIKSAGT